LIEINRVALGKKATNLASTPICGEAQPANPTQPQTA